eukprot:scaffold2044_cov202-Prasinococcus_capsulatus_cf.AAC.13
MRTLWERRALHSAAGPRPVRCTALCNNNKSCSSSSSSCGAGGSRGTPVCRSPARRRARTYTWCGRAPPPPLLLLVWPSCLLARGARGRGACCASAAIVRSPSPLRAALAADKATRGKQLASRNQRNAFQTCAAPNKEERSTRPTTAARTRLVPGPLGARVAGLVQEDDLAGACRARAAAPPDQSSSRSSSRDCCPGPCRGGAAASPATSTQEASAALAAAAGLAPRATSRCERSSRTAHSCLCERRPTASAASSRALSRRGARVGRLLAPRRLASCVCGLVRSLQLLVTTPPPRGRSSRRAAAASA